MSEGYHFYILKRRETDLYVLGDTETSLVNAADRYYSRKLAQRANRPNTYVCGPYTEKDHETP